MRRVVHEASLKPRGDGFELVLSETVVEGVAFPSHNHTGITYTKEEKENLDQLSREEQVAEFRQKCHKHPYIQGSKDVKEKVDRILDGVLTQ